MRPWGGKGRAAEKADDKVQGREAVGAMGHGTNEAMERHGAGRAEGAGTFWSAVEREGRRGRRAKRVGMHWDPLKSWSPGRKSDKVHGREAVGPWSHGAP